MGGLSFFKRYAILVWKIDLIALKALHKVESDIVVIAHFDQALHLHPKESHTSAWVFHLSILLVMQVPPLYLSALFDTVHRILMYLNQCFFTLMTKTNWIMVHITFIDLAEEDGTLGDVIESTIIIFHINKNCIDNYIYISDLLSASSKRYVRRPTFQANYFLFVKRQTFFLQKSVVIDNSEWFSCLPKKILKQWLHSQRLESHSKDR